MPFYTTVCKQCAARGSVYRKIAERNDLPACDCGGELFRPVEAPRVVPDITPYQSPATGQWVTSATERRNDLARSNCVPYDPGMKQDAQRNADRALREADTLVDHFVDKTAGELAACGRL